MPRIQSLHDMCVKALENYAQEAQKTCELLCDLEGNPDTLDRLLALMERTQIEDQAQRAYLLLRQQLFDGLGLEVMKENGKCNG
jgi:hypothetical protein